MDTHVKLEMGFTCESGLANITFEGPRIRVAKHSIDVENVFSAGRE